MKTKRRKSRHAAKAAPWSNANLLMYYCSWIPYQ